MVSAVVLMLFVQPWVVLTALLGGALFRVYSMATNVDVDKNSMYEVRRMPMTQQGQMYHTRAGSHHGNADTSEKYSLDDVQQYSSRFSSLLLLRRAHTVLLRVGNSLTRTDCSPAV